MSDKKNKGKDFMNIIAQILGLAFFSGAALAHDGSSQPLSGTVKQLVCGEIDPFAIGDACVLTIAVDNNGSILLVADEEITERLTPEVMFSLKGKKIKVDPAGLEAVEDEDALAVLNQGMSVPRRAFWWDGNLQN